MEIDELQALREWLAMYQSVEAVLGKRNWRLLCGYGRVMSGPHSGLYVSGIPASATQAFVDALIGGEQIHVHLMHRHVSGNYESSRLRFDGVDLWMHFEDRTERA